MDKLIEIVNKYKFQMLGGLAVFGLLIIITAVVINNDNNDGDKQNDEANSEYEELFDDTEIAALNGDDFFENEEKQPKGNGSLNGYLNREEVKPLERSVKSEYNSDYSAAEHENVINEDGEYKTESPEEMTEGAKEAQISAEEKRVLESLYSSDEYGKQQPKQKAREERSGNYGGEREEEKPAVNVSRSEKRYKDEPDYIDGVERRDSKYAKYAEHGEPREDQIESERYAASPNPDGGYKQSCGPVGIRYFIVDYNKRLRTSVRKPILITIIGEGPEAAVFAKVRVYARRVNARREILSKQLLFALPKIYVAEGRTQTQFYWSGKDFYGDYLPEGEYILYAELEMSDGKQKFIGEAARSPVPKWRHVVSVK